MSYSDAASAFMDVPVTASVFGIRLRVLITVILVSFILLVIFLLTFCFICIRNRRRKRKRNRNRNNMSLGSMEMEELGHVEGGWYTLRELRVATNGLSESNVIGKGGYGIVYRGILPDGTKVAVKNLFNKPEAERDFKAEVEVIGRVRHKNLVRLLGYCVEGPYMMLVYEYVDNGSLDQWLHENVASVSPLTWDIRMNIMLGTAKGLAYLHEGLEQKVVHRDVKSSNVLLDSEWNAKVSDFGLVKLMCADHSYVATRVLGTFGYVAPEYASTGMLNEKSDVYSFGMLIMEMITGRSPVDYSRPKRQINLIEWMKTQFGNKTTEEVVDPKLPEKPSQEALKRALMVAIRCVDPDPTKRPKMGNVVHLLEADDLLFLHPRIVDTEYSSSDADSQQEHGDSSSHKKPISGEIIDKREDNSDSDSSLDKKLKGKEIIDQKEQEHKDSSLNKKPEGGEITNQKKDNCDGDYHQEHKDSSLDKKPIGREITDRREHDSGGDYQKGHKDSSLIKSS
ncbi:unnamed protein product [Lupinus luteus]|uniref:non-specific serine/threonine protein kinase n=1 Tax=Lupinus luteus TaxID=3873 RepID=A0AAV1X045_LUPLU